MQYIFHNIRRECTSTPKMIELLKLHLMFSSVAQSCLTLCDPRAYSTHAHCVGVATCHSTISSSFIPFFCHLQSFPASGSFQMSQFSTSGGQTIGVSASASVLPMNIQDWFPLELTGSISLQSKGLSRVFSNTTVQMHQFFGTQLSLESNCHNHMWLLEKP